MPDLLRLLPEDFAEPAGGIFSDTKWLKEFSKVQKGFDEFRVRMALIDALNLGTAVERWVEAYAPTPDGGTIDWAGFSLLRAAIEFTNLYLSILNEQCLGEAEPMSVLEACSARPARRRLPLASGQRRRAHQAHATARPQAPPCLGSALAGGGDGQEAGQ